MKKRPPFKLAPESHSDGASDAAPPKKGGILAALRRSPLVGVCLNLRRSHDAGRQ